MCWPFTEYELEEVPQKPPPKPSPKKKRVKRKRVHWWSSLSAHMVPMYAPRRPDFAPQPFFSPPFDMPYGYNYYPNDCVIYNNPANRQHIWYGRTEAEVREDNKILAERDGANGRHEIAPRNPRPDQSFWVRDLDGTRYVRPYQFIEDNLRPGEWRLDQRYGNLYFVRTRGDD